MYIFFNAYKKYLNYLFFSILVVFSFFFILLAIFRIEDTISIQATIISETKYTIKSQINGDIEEIFFKNGNRVQKDDILFMYSRRSIKQNIIEIDYIITEKINFRELILKTAFEVIYYHKLNNDNLNNKLAYSMKQLEYYDKIYKSREILYEIGGVSLDELNKQKLELDRLNYEYIMLLIEKENYEKNYNLNIELLKSYGISTINMENVNIYISGIDEEINFFNEQKNTYNSLLNNPYIVSPVNGTVNFYESYYYNDTAKTKLQANDLICDIYMDDDFIAKGIIQDMYLPFININDDVYIQVNAYDYNRYGFIYGNITNIYPSPITNDGQKQYYIDASFDPLPVRLYNGLEATIKIKLNEEQSVLIYIIENILLDEKRIKQNDILFINRKIMK